MMKAIYDYFCDRTLAYLALNTTPAMFKSAAFTPKYYGMRGDEMYLAGDPISTSAPDLHTQLTGLGISGQDAARIAWNLRNNPDQKTWTVDTPDGPLSFYRQGNRLIPVQTEFDASGVDFSSLNPAARALHSVLAGSPASPQQPQIPWQAFLPGLLLGMGGMPGMGMMGMPGMFGM
jgi:hypothetical protein